MEVIVASVDHIKFDIDYALEEQFGALPLPFPGMDSKSRFFKLVSRYSSQFHTNNQAACVYVKLS